MTLERTKSLLRLSVSESEYAWFHATPKGDSELQLCRLPLDLKGPFVDKTPEHINQDHPGWKQYALREVQRITGFPVDELSINNPAPWSLIIELMELYIRRKYVPPDEPFLVTAR